MKQDHVLSALQLVSSMRHSLGKVRQFVDEEALQVGDRNVLNQSMNTIAPELEVLTRTFQDILGDPTKSE